MSDTTPLSVLHHARQLSDQKQYEGKGRLLHLEMFKHPDDWVVDDDRAPNPGLTHTPTGYQFHLPRAYIPSSVLNRDRLDPADTSTHQTVPDAQTKEAMIKKEGDEYVLYTKDGDRILGRHPTRQAAIDQEYAIQKSQEKQAAQAPDPFVQHLDDPRYFGRPGSVVRAQDILTAANAHGLDPRLLAAVVANESAYGTAGNAVQANNFSGMMGSGSQLYQYDTPAAGLDAAARLLRTRYVDRGLTTPEAIGPVYAPTEGATNDPTGMNNNWVSTVSSIMNRVPEPLPVEPAPLPAEPAPAQPAPAQPTPTPTPVRAPATYVPTQANPPVNWGMDADGRPWYDIPQGTPDYPPDYPSTDDLIQQPPTPAPVKSGALAPRTGPQALARALSEIDLDALEAEQRAVIKSGARSKRARAIQVLNIVEGMRRNDLTPDQLLISRVPVIPAQFRPFSAQGTTFIPGDANVLYKDLMNLKRAYEQERQVFGPEGAGATRAALYDGVKAVYGFGPPTNEKARAKDVSGFLQKVLGKSAKYGYTSRRLLGKTQDFTARSVIGVNPDLGMDEIGLPEDMAWTLYGPWVQRRLVRSGMGPGKALEGVRDRTDHARKALEREMGERPVIYSRSPAWHKYSVISGRPQLAEGKAIKANPFTVEALGGDFDGNCVKIGTKLRIKVKNVTVGLGGDFDEEIVTIVVDNKEARGYGGRLMRITPKTKVLSRSESNTILEIPIEEFPRTGAPTRARDGGLMYNVPEGVEVLTNAPDGKGIRWSPVTSFTVDGVKPIRKLTTSMNRVAEVSDNESVAVYAPGGVITRIRPDDLTDEHLIPIMRNLPESESGTHDTEFGWLIGSFVSDGWVNGPTLGYTKCDPRKRQRFLAAVTAYCGEQVDVRNYAEMHEALSDYGIGGSSEKIHINVKNGSPDRLRELFDRLSACYHPDIEDRDQTAHRSCLFKRLPEHILDWSREARLGVLAGLLDGDGSVSVNRSRGKPQVLVNFSTSSPYLRDSVQLLCLSLGVRCSVSVLKPKAGRLQKHDNYILNLGAVDISRLIEELVLCDQDTEGVQLLKAGLSNDNRDFIPVDFKVLEDMLVPGAYPEQCPAFNKRSVATLKSNAKLGGDYTRVSREAALNYLEHYQGDKSTPHWRAFQNLAQDRSLGWERVKSVEDTGEEQVFDIGVPETKVYALSNGIIIYDTFNVHLPATDESVQEAKDRLMPSKMLFKTRDPDQTYGNPKHEAVLGLSNAMARPAKNRHTFRSQDEALDAIRKQRISLQDEIEIDPAYQPPVLTSPQNPDKLTSL